VYTRPEYDTTFFVLNAGTNNGMIVISIINQVPVIINFVPLANSYAGITGNSLF